MTKPELNQWLVFDLQLTDHKQEDAYVALFLFSVTL